MCRVSSAVMMGICVIYCLGQGFGQSNITTYALRGLPLENNADGTAVINTLQQLFGAIGCCEQRAVGIVKYAGIGDFVYIVAPYGAKDYLSAVLQVL